MSAAVVTLIILATLAGLGWGAAAGLAIALKVALRETDSEDPPEKDPNEVLPSRNFRAVGER